MATSSRATSVKTPGVVSPDENQAQDVAQQLGQASSGKVLELGDGVELVHIDPPAPAPDLPADLQSLIDAAVARKLAELNPGRPTPATPSTKLPTEKEALAIVIANGGRAELSDAGYVCLPPNAAKVQRDANGFAKD